MVTPDKVALIQCNSYSFLRKWSNFVGSAVGCLKKCGIMEERRCDKGSDKWEEDGSPFRDSTVHFWITILPLSSPKAAAIYNIAGSQWGINRLVFLRK